MKINENGYLVTKVNMASLEPMEYLGQEIGKEANKVYTVYRKEEELFNDETIKSFEGKPITLTHPNDVVNASNWKDEAIGHIQNVRREGKFLVADAYINDEIAINIIKNHGIKEVSLGYESKLVEEGGKIYQTNIRGNHLAVVSEGRAGKECKLNDKKTNERIKLMNKLKELLLKLKDSEPENEENKEIVKTLEEALAENEELKAENERLKAEIEELKKKDEPTTVADEETVSAEESQDDEVKRLKAENEELKKIVEELKAKIKELEDEKDLSSAVNDAKTYFSKVKISDSKNARDVYTAVLVDSGFEVEDLKKLSDSEIRAMYLGLKANAVTKDNALRNYNSLFDSKPQKLDLNKKFGGKK